MDPYSDPAYVQAKNNADTAYQQYGTAAANTQTMPDMLKRVLDQKFASQNNPLYGQQEQASKDYFNSLDTGYQAVLPENNQGMIFSPEAQQQQIQGKRNSLLAALASVNQMIGGGFGGIENIIGEATKNYQAQEMAAKFKADLARQKVSDLFAEIAKREEIRQYNEQLKLEKEKVNKAGGSDMAFILALVAALSGQEQGGDGRQPITDAYEEDKKPKKSNIPAKAYDLSSLNIGMGNVGSGAYTGGGVNKTSTPKKQSEPMYMPKSLEQLGIRL